MISKVCCVTGGTGFLGSSLLKLLLEKGYIVHATVRDPHNKAKVSHLLSLPGAEEQLKLFQADLLKDGSFDDIIAGCDGVFHVASPVEFTPGDPEEDLLKPAIQGTLNILKACSKSKTVKRVMVTSSVAAVFVNESFKENKHIDESYWSDVNFLQNKRPHVWEYLLSKTLAEQVAWEYVNEHGLDMVTVNPGIVGGSCITPTVPFSIKLALSPLPGNLGLFQGLKDLQTLFRCIPLVHVEDVCNAHIFLMENSSIQGRHICSPINISVQQIVEYLIEHHSRYNVATEMEDVSLTTKVNISSKKLVESGFTFQYGLEEIYDHAIDYLKTKGNLLV